MNRKVKAVLIVICLIAIGIGVFNIWSIQRNYNESARSYAALDSYVSAPEGDSGTQQETAAAVPAQTAPIETLPVDDWDAPDVTFPEVNFQELSEINPEIVGWIYIDGTAISYPVAHGEDNKYYMEHLFDHTPNGSGCIFLDYTNAPGFTDRNNVLYGHNIKNGTMFFDLQNYKEQEFFDEHPYGLLMTPYGNFVIEFYCGYVISGWGNAWQTHFDTDADYEAWLQGGTEQALVHSETVPSADDLIITLSTCTYEFYDARFVMHGILHRVS